MPGAPSTKCRYPTGDKKPLEYAGYALLALGALMLFLCVPCWAWLALLGAALIAAGFLLLKISRRWR